LNQIVRCSLLIFTLPLLAMVSGCAHTAVRFQGGPQAGGAVSGPISVLVLPGPALPPDSAGFSTLLLGLARERDPQAAMASGSSGRGNGLLLIATVHGWRDADTRYSGEPDRVEITVQLVRQQPREVLREFQFSAKSSPLAVRDAPAERLLGEKFRRSVRELLAIK
jgi:hypothetical protein